MPSTTPLAIAAPVLEASIPVKTARALAAHPVDRSPVKNGSTSGVVLLGAALSAAVRAAAAAPGPCPVNAPRTPPTGEPRASADVAQWMARPTSLSAPPTSARSWDTR